MYILFSIVTEKKFHKIGVFKWWKCILFVVLKDRNSQSYCQQGCSGDYRRKALTRLFQLLRLPAFLDLWMYHFILYLHSHILSPLWGITDSLVGQHVIQPYPNPNPKPESVTPTENTFPVAKGFVHWRCANHWSHCSSQSVL